MTEPAPERPSEGGTEAEQQRDPHPAGGSGRVSRVEFKDPHGRVSAVEIHNEVQKKKFLGGFRHKKTGMIFHHAQAQTRVERPVTVQCVRTRHSSSQRGQELKFHRTTQTVKHRSRSQQTRHEMGTQMARKDLLLTETEDKVVQPGKYETSEEYMRKKVACTVRIQCFVRLCMAWRAANRLMQAAEEKEREEQRVAVREKGWRGLNAGQEEEEKRLKKKKDTEVARRMKPQTRKDFDVLAEELEAWRLFETNRIQQDERLSQQEKHSKLHALLDREVKFLQTIDRLKEQAVNERQDEATKKLLHRMAAANVMETEGDNPTVHVDTPYTVHARELVELYYGLTLPDLPRNQRLDVLLNVKYAVKDLPPAMNGDVLALIERETELLTRARHPKSLQGLRRRLANCFLDLLKDPTFNPEAKKYVKPKARLRMKGRR